MALGTTTKKFSSFNEVLEAALKFLNLQIQRGDPSHEKILFCEIVSKITKNAIWPNFDTFSKISQSVVITWEKIIHIWNQLIKTVILISINPIQTKKIFFHQKGPPFEFANSKILEKPLELLQMS